MLRRRALAGVQRLPIVLVNAASEGTRAAITACAGASLHAAAWTQAGRSVGCEEAAILSNGAPAMQPATNEANVHATSFRHTVERPARIVERLLKRKCGGAIARVCGTVRLAAGAATSVR